MEYKSYGEYLKSLREEKKLNIAELRRKIRNKNRNYKKMGKRFRSTNFR